MLRSEKSRPSLTTTLLLFTRGKIFIMAMDSYVRRDTFNEALMVLRSINAKQNSTIVENRILQLEGISFGARGLYLYILTLDNVSDFSVKKMAKNGNISVKKCKKLLKELTEAGLIQAEIYKKIMEIM